MGGDGLHRPSQRHSETKVSRQGIEPRGSIAPGYLILREFLDMASPAKSEPDTGMAR